MNQRTPYQAFQPTSIPPPPNAEPTVRERVARLKVLARRATRYWRVPALILVVGCGVALFLALRVKLIFRSEATFLFKPAIRMNDRPDDEGDSRAQRIGAKLKDVLTTRTRLEGLIKKFDLYPRIVEQRGLVEAVSEMADHIGFRARDSETYVISFENEDPEVTQNVTKALADSMIDEFTQNSANAVQAEASFLGKQERRSSDELEAANKSLATFLTLHPEFSLEAKTTAFGAAAGAPMQPAVPLMPNMPKDPSMGDPQLGALYRQKARLEAEQKMDGTGAQGAQPAAPTGADAIARLTMARDEAAKNAAAAASDLADRRTRLTDAHPDVISAKLAADTAARALRQAEMALAASQAASAGSNPYDAVGGDGNVQKQISAINAQIFARSSAMHRGAVSATDSDAGVSGVTAFAATSELVQLETEWQRLLSTLHDVRVEHDDLKQKLERAKLSASAAESQGGDTMMVIDPAYLPLHPSKGGRTKTALTGGILALILALGYAFARVLFNDTIIDSADVEAMNLLPVLGVLPKVRPTGTPAPGAPTSPPKEIQRVV
jgi:uncharacterized protein involved in exopolysaccharide biosynthesis